jgi:hypothetical protein
MLAWHRHEMLFGFAVAIVAGFLLTAVQNWSGLPGFSGRWLQGAVPALAAGPRQLVPGPYRALLVAVAAHSCRWWRWPWRDRSSSGVCAATTRSWRWCCCSPLPVDHPARLAEQDERGNGVACSPGCGWWRR